MIQPQPVMQHSFSQFVFDNADHNVNTIDGFQTFHAMGGIQCITPTTSVSSNEIIPKLKKIPSACTVGTFGHIPLKTFQKSNKFGLANITIEDLSKRNPVPSEVTLTPCDFAWIYGKWKDIMLHTAG